MISINRTFSDLECHHRINGKYNRWIAISAMALLGFVLSPPGAEAAYCSRDVAPASTLLVPYAVVAMNGGYTDPNGITTTLRVTNAFKDPQLINITVWNASGGAVVNWMVALSGYDVWTMDFRDMLNGDFQKFDTSVDESAPPNTGNRTPFEWGPDGRSAYGLGTGLATPGKTSDTPYAECLMPYGNQALFGEIIRIKLRQALFSRIHFGCDLNNDGTAEQTVRPDRPGSWIQSPNQSGAIVYFYATVNVLHQCTKIFPTSESYYPLLKNANVLLGDVTYVNATNGVIASLPAVHIESQLIENLAVNFYSEIAGAGNPHTEPLGSAVAFPYDKSTEITTSLLLWKNYTEFTTSGSVLDAGSYVYYAWDEDEHVISRTVGCAALPCQGAVIDPNVFPYKTQIVPVDLNNFDLPADRGWISLIFPSSYGPSYPTGNDPTPNNDPFTIARNYQIWASTVRTPESALSSAYLEAAYLGNSYCYTNQVLPGFGMPDGPPPGSGHIPGDVNGDGRVDSLDLVYMVNFTYSGGPGPK